MAKCCAVMALNGYFRTYEEKVNSHNGEVLRGYHKPIMLAGAIGNIRADHVQKDEIYVGSKLVVLCVPAINIGLGGGAASSMASGQSDADLDFASVQRDNPEMERRCQEVIDRCWQLGDANPILFIQNRSCWRVGSATFAPITYKKTRSTLVRSWSFSAARQ